MNHQASSHRVISKNNILNRLMNTRFCPNLGLCSLISHTPKVFVTKSSQRIVWAGSSFVHISRQYIIELEVNCMEILTHCYFNTWANKIQLISRSQNISLTTFVNIRYSAPVLYAPYGIIIMAQVALKTFDKYLEKKRS